MRRMKCSTASHLLTVATGGVLAAALAASPAHAIEVQCAAAGDGDAFGWAVAGGGDFDGDGITDVAVGAPCAWVGQNEKAGRVRVFSGATGRRIASLKGIAAVDRYGSALAFVPDLNGDGKAELVIGSSTFDAPKISGGFRVGAGRVEVRSAKNGGTVLWEVQGSTDFGNLGETVAALPDLNGDGKAEIAVGASRGQVGGSRDGIAFVLSGANGSVVTQNDALFPEERWASVVESAGDVNGDGTGDWLASSNIVSLPVEAIGGLDDPMGVDVSTTTSSTTTTSTTTTTLVDRVGRVSIISGKSPFAVIKAHTGTEPRQRMGRSAAATGDFDGDFLGDLWIGSMGATIGNQAEAGAIDLFSGLGTFLRRIVEPTPQSFAAFGSSLAVPGSLDGGIAKDVVAGAPLATVNNRAGLGRVHAFDSTTSGLLWSQTGTLAGERFGHSLATGPDFNSDGVKDIVVGAPGASPNGRRGAGAAFLLSGKNGKVIATFNGRRGRETRLFVGGPGLDRRSLIRSFDPFGRRREAEIRAFRGEPSKSLSMAILDPGDRSVAGNTLLAVAGGKGGGSPTVAVYKAIRRRLRVSQFTAGPDGYTGSLNVAGGNFAAQAGDEIAVVPADDITGTADVVLYRRTFTDPVGRITWSKVQPAEAGTFPAFQPTDKIEGTLINAVGVNIAGGNIQKTAEPDQHEIVIAPAAGLPVVRVLRHTGALISEWQAYPVSTPNLGTNSGTSIAVANLKGDTSRQILTAPARGQLWVRAWRLNGDPFQMVDGGLDVSFFVTQFGPVFEGGLTVTAADVDFDGADEILVAPGAGLPAQVWAFEADGTPVVGWAPFQPMGPIANRGLTLLGMNDFWRP